MSANQLSPMLWSMPITKARKPAHLCYPKFAKDGEMLLCMCVERVMNRGRLLLNTRLLQCSLPKPYRACFWGVYANFGRIRR